MRSPSAYGYGLYSMSEVRDERTVDWYVKWVASVLILISIAFRAADGYAVWDLAFGTGGVVGWLTVSIMWKDRALILLNGVSLMMLVIGLLNHV